MTLNLRLIKALVLLVPVFSACSSPEEVLLEAFPDGEVNRYEALEFKFDKPLAPEDSLGHWADGDYLTFEPELAGKYYWSDDQTLRFQPTGGLEPATEYTAHVNASVLFGNDKLAPPSQVIHFHSPYLKVTESKISWYGEEKWGYNTPLLLELNFNMEIDPDDLEEHMLIRIDGEEADKFDVGGWSGSMHHEIYLDAGDYQGQPLEVEFLVKNGLQANGVSVPLKEDYRESLALQPRSNLTFGSVSAYPDGQQVRLEVWANQPVSESEIRAHLNVLPETDFDLSVRGNKLTLRGDFPIKSLVKLAFESGMRGKLGGVMDSTFEALVITPDRNPFLRFSDPDGYYLMRDGEENIAVTTVNTPEFEYVYYEIYENNLLHFLNANRYMLRGRYRGYSYDEYYDGYGSDLSLRNYGKEVHSEKVILNEGEANRVETISIPVNERFRSKYQGIMAMGLRKKEDYYDHDAKVISLSDIGLIARKSENEVTVFVNALSTARPLGGVLVKLISETNQEMARGTSDAQGVVRFRNLDKAAPGFEPRLITALRGSDFNFMDLDLSHQYRETHDFVTRYDQSDYDAFMYAEANLFRPGDTVHIHTILRNPDLEPVRNEPFVMKVLSPGGGVVATTKHQSNDYGSFETPVILPVDATTGYYRAELYTGDDREIESFGFQVEEFVPHKIAVNLQATEPVVHPGDTAKFPVDVRYYFGAVADSHQYSYRFRFNEHAFRTSRYPDFDFSYSNATELPLEYTDGEGLLDARGQTTLSYPLPADLKSSGLVTLTAYLTAFDNGGRTVSKSKSVQVQTASEFLGVRTSGSYFSTGQTGKMDWIVTDADGKAMPHQPVVVTVHRLEWKKSIRRSQGHIRHVAETDLIPVVADTLRSGAEIAHFQWEMKYAGDYILKARLLNSTYEHEHTMTVYGRDYMTSSSFGVSKEGAITIQFDKELYKTGETARVLFKTPFSGRMLVTVEREDLIDYRFVDVTDNAAEIRLPLDGRAVPNIFVSATLIRPHRNDAPLPLTVAHGTQPVRVLSSRDKLAVSVETPEHVKPGERQLIRVKTGAGQAVQVTLAVVDEGILAINNYTTPKPYDHFYQSKPLRVSAYDMYKMLLPEVENRKPYTGGGDGLYYSNITGFTNQVLAERFKPITIWSGEIRTDGAGNANIPVTIPDDFNGEVRLMAVAHAGRRFGSGQASMKVRHDVVVVPAIPRFVTTGDSQDVAVNLFNTTEEPQKVRLDFKVDGPLTVSGPAYEGTIPPEGSVMHKFGMVGQQDAGKADLHYLLQVDGQDHVQELNIEMSVRPPSATTSIAQSGKLEAGQSLKIPVPDDFMPSTAEGRLYISSIPMLEMAPHLRYLVQYPHGCAEQTTSRVFPQLYFSDLAEYLMPETFDRQNAVYHVREGIRRLTNMQNGYGGFNYWSGYNTSNDWTSIYVTHFLVEARKAGYPVQEAVIDMALQHLRQNAANSRTESYEYAQNGQWKLRTEIAREIPYALYVLALAGEPSTPIMNHYKEKMAALSLDGRYLLAAAFALAGDMASYAEVLPPSWNPQPGARSDGGSFTSNVQRVGVMLNALLEADPGNPQVGLMVEWLAANTEDMLNTQDKAWAFLALGKAMQRQRGDRTVVAVTLDQQSLGTFNGSNWRKTSKDWAGKTLELNNTGRGQAYYYWYQQGVAKSIDLEAEDTQHGLVLRRTYRDPAGNLIPQPLLRQGELIVCELEVTSTKMLRNVAISDLLPSCFEVENPRLNAGEYHWIKDLPLNLYHQDIRDDRVLAYPDLIAGERFHLRYLVRVTGLGKFVLPPAFAESMYDPEIQGRSKGTHIRVLPATADLPRLRPQPKAPEQAIAGQDSVTASSLVGLWKDLARPYHAN